MGRLLPPTVAATWWTPARDTSQIAPGGSSTAVPGASGRARLSPVTRRRVSTITKSPAQRPWRSGDPLQISTLRLAQLSNSPCSPAARTDGAHRNSRDRQPGPSCPPTGSFTWPLSEAANSAWLGVAIQQLPQVMRHRSGVDVAVGHHALLSPIVAAPARLAAWCIGRAPRHGRPRPNRSGARAGAGRPTPSYLCRRNAVNTAVTR